MYCPKLTPLDGSDQCLRGIDTAKLGFTGSSDAEWVWTSSYDADRIGSDYEVTLTFAFDFGRVPGVQAAAEMEAAEMTLFERAYSMFEVDPARQQTMALVGGGVLAVMSMAVCMRYGSRSQKEQYEELV